MSMTLILFVAAALLILVATVFHIIMLVNGFKTSAGWGLVCLLVPFGSLVFAFTKFGGGRRKVMAAIFLLAFLGGFGCAGVASYQTAVASIGSAQAMAEGMKEAEQQIQDLEQIEDIQLDL